MSYDRFVNSETIQEYVSSEQLLVNFGGSDTWQFDYEREKEVMLKQLREVLEREAEGDGEGEEEGKGEGEGEGKGKGEGEGEGKGEGGTVENRMLRSSEVRTGHCCCSVVHCVLFGLSFIPVTWNRIRVVRVWRVCQRRTEGVNQGGRGGQIVRRRPLKEGRRGARTTEK